MGRSGYRVTSRERYPGGHMPHPAYPEKAGAEMQTEEEIQGHYGLQAQAAGDGESTKAAI